MGLDMYLYKVKKINRGMNILIEGKTFMDEELMELQEKYSVAIESDYGERGIPAALKIGTKVLAKQTMYRPADIIEKFKPEINIGNIKDVNAGLDDDGKYRFYVYLKDKGDEAVEFTVTAEEVKTLSQVFESDAYVYEREEVCYWRKANQIREWFVKNLKEPVENCEISSVSKDELEKLIKDCMEVLANKDKAKDIMPTSSGFFFGGTDYDEYYYQDIARTLNSMLEIKESIDWQNETLYYTEWW